MLFASSLKAEERLAGWIPQKETAYLSSTTISNQHKFKGGRGMRSTANFSHGRDL
jgi:hypothetical protein